MQADFLPAELPGKPRLMINVCHYYSNDYFCSPHHSMKQALVSFRAKKIDFWGTFLVVLWLRLCTSNARDVVQSLVGELRSHMPLGESKTKKKRVDLWR